MQVPDDLPPHPAGNAWEAQVKMPLLVMTRELEVVVGEEMIQQDGPRRVEKDPGSGPLRKPQLAFQPAPNYMLKDYVLCSFYNANFVLVWVAFSLLPLGLRQQRTMKPGLEEDMN